MKRRTMMLNVGLALCVAWTVGVLVVTGFKLDRAFKGIDAIHEQFRACNRITIGNPVTRDDVALALGRPTREERIQGVLGPAARVYFRYAVEGLPEPYFDFDDRLGRAVAMDCRDSNKSRREMTPPPGYQVQQGVQALLPGPGPRQ